MSSTTRYYTFTEEDGDEIKFRYITNTCHCGGCCYEDVLDVAYEDEWISMNIENSDIKNLITRLIQDAESVTLTEEVKHES